MRSTFPWLVLVGCLAITASPADAKDMPLSELLIEGEGWELVAEGYKFTEGPAADGQGNLYFSDIPNNRIHKIDADGKVSVFVEDSHATNGLMFGPDGRLYGCQNGKERIVAFDAEGNAEAIAEGVHCNDLVVTHQGGVYFTDPPGKRVWYVDPKGQKRVVADDVGRPNGIILWADQGTLVVTDSTRPVLWTFRVESDGNLAFKEPYYPPRVLPGRQVAGSDGMTVDTDGRLYLASYAGLQVFDTQGRLSGVLDKPQPAFLSNVTFGGPDLAYLYVTCSDKVYRRKTNARGVLFFKPPLLAK